MFHAATLDLRLPEVSGGALTSQPYGLGLVTYYADNRPLAWAHMFSAHAREYALEAYRRLPNSKQPPTPIWEKAICDTEGEDHYDSEQWAQRILTVLLPKSKAMTLPLVQQRPSLKEHLDKLSPLGESVDFAIDSGREHLPPCLAKSFAIVHRWLDGGERQFELAAYKEILFLAETLQHWLLIQAAAWLAAFQPESVAWPLSKTPNAARAAMEKSLRAMLRAISESPHKDHASAWLSHLNWWPGEPTSMDIVDALGIIRDKRNGFAHRGHIDDLPWEEIAMPMRVLMDAAGFLAAYPMVFAPAPARDGRWHFTVLKGEKSPKPVDEWLLPGGVLGQTGRFDPGRDDLNLYQLWPCPDGGLALLKLWPFAEQRKQANGDKTFWLLYGPDAHKPNRLWERSASDGGEACNDGIAPSRLEALRHLLGTGSP
jgi:hypothetical protein